MRKWSALLLLLCTTISGSVAGEVPWTGKEKIIKADGKNIEVALDPSGSPSLTEILDNPGRLRFQPSEKLIPAISGKQAGAWLRFSLSNQTDKDLKLMLEIEYPTLDSVSVFIVRDREILKSYPALGRFTDLKNQPYALIFPTVPVNLPPDEKITVYIRLQNQAFTAKFPVSIREENDFWSTLMKRNYFRNSLMEFILVIGILALITGFLAKWYFFIWYGAYVTALFLFVFNSTGQVAETLPQQWLWNPVYDLHILFVSLHYIFNLYYVRSFLRAELLRYSWLNRGMTVLGLINLFFLLFLSFIPSYKTHEVFMQKALFAGNSMVIVNLLFVITAIFIGLIHKNRMARTYLIATVPFLIYLFYSRLTNLEYIRGSSVHTNAFLIVICWDVTFMAIVIAKRVIQALRPALTGHESISDMKEQPEVISDNPPVKDTRPVSAVSNREIEIIRLYCQGMSYQDIADTLFISPQTVRTHLKNIYQKLGIHGKAEAVQWAIKNKIL